MVHRSVLYLIRKGFAAAILFGMFLLFASGCGDTERPTSLELATANIHFADSVHAAQISLSFVDEDVILAYSSEVLFQGKSSCWEGKARVLYKLTVFEQVCKTYTLADGSWKAWRSTYAKTDTISPTSLIEMWLAQAAAGEGSLIGSPVMASEVSDAFPEAYGEVYLLALEESQVDWSGLCDAHIDTLFGGAKLLETAGDCKVTLMFRRDTKQLAGIFLSAMEGETALEGAIVISQAQEIPMVDSSIFASGLEETPLGEEWEILTK